jgi:long-chain acyl-CoA synthetase
MTRVLLTGATGSFGRYIARELLARGCEVVAAARGRDDAETRERVLAAVRPSAPERLTVARAELGALEPRGLIATCDAVLHSAASTLFGSPLSVARRTNLEGTRTMLELAERLPRLESFGYVGTAFVAGRRVGRVWESELEHCVGFVNTYEQSKYEAELAARASSLPVAVFRPTVIVEDEPTESPTAIRFILQLIARGLLPVLPGPAEATLDVIAASDAAAAIVQLLLSQGRGVYHVGSGDRAPRVADVVHAGAGREVGFLPEAESNRQLARLESRSPRARRLYAALRPCIGVLAHPKVFDTQVAEAALGCPSVRVDPLLLVRETLREAA